MEIPRLLVDGHEHDPKRENTSLFTFIGENAMYDHVFLAVRPESENRVIGGYVWRTLQPHLYEPYVRLIKKFHFPQHLYQNEVAQCDIDAFNNSAYEDLAGTDGVPEGWENGSK